MREKFVRKLICVIAALALMVALAPSGIVLAVDQVMITGAVRIEGTPQAGRTLTAVYSEGNSAEVGDNISYQWYYVNGDNLDAITGATSRTYTIQYDDIGHIIQVVVSGTGAYNGSIRSIPAETVTSFAPTQFTRLDNAVNSISLECQTSSVFSVDTAKVFVAGQTLLNDGKEKRIIYGYSTGSDKYNYLKYTSDSVFNDHFYDGNGVTVDDINENVDSIDYYVFGTAAFKTPVTGTVTITGPHATNATLSAIYTDGNSADVGSSLSYQWYEHFTGSGEEISRPITDSGNGQTYKVLVNQEGRMISVKIRGTGAFTGELESERVPEIPGEHSYNEEVVAPRYLKSAADYEHPAIYYKSCICGESSEGTIVEDTFEYGSALTRDSGGNYNTTPNTYTDPSSVNKPAEENKDKASQNGKDEGTSEKPSTKSELKEIISEVFSESKVAVTANRIEDAAFAVKKGSKYFDENGKAIRNSFVVADGGRVKYVGANGKPVKQAVVATLDPDTGGYRMFYVNRNGVVVMNKVVRLSDGIKAFAGEDGSLATDQLVDSGKHYANADGTLAKSCWVTVGDKMYRCNKKGRITKVKDAE